MYDIAGSTNHVNGSISIDIRMKEWVVITKVKNKPRPFLVESISVNLNLFGGRGNRPLFTTAPSISVRGKVADASGGKWLTRYSWNSVPNLPFEQLPSNVKQHIFTTVESLVRESIVQSTADYKKLVAANAFRRTTDPHFHDRHEPDEDDPFLESVSSATELIDNTEVSVYETMAGLENFPVTRKMFNLPKPKRKRKAANTNTPPLP